jgi:hypothetical protein
VMRLLYNSSILFRLNLGYICNSAFVVSVSRLQLDLFKALGKLDKEIGVFEVL